MTLPRHFLEGLLLTILAYALTAAADYAKANPVPSWDPALVAVGVGALLAAAAYVREALKNAPADLTAWRHFAEGLVATVAAIGATVLADQLRLNPLPGYDPALTAVLVGALLVVSKTIRDGAAGQAAA